MQEFLSILKYLATSNTINFIIMVTLLAIIVKKMNLGASLEKSIEVVKATISKSDEEKSGAQKKLDSAKGLIEKLPQDIKNLEQTSKEKVEVFKDKIDENAQKAIFNIEKNIDRHAICLPSTSPANAAWKLERLIEAWSVINCRYS